MSDQSDRVPIELRAPFHDLEFMSPLSSQRADRLVDFLVADQPDLILDVGCGWAALLLRAVAASSARGLGVDAQGTSVEHGQELAAAMNLGDRIELRVGDARVNTPSGVDAVICVGASQIWSTETGSSEPLDYEAALSALRALVSPGGRVVYGEGIWSSEPTDAAIAPLGQRLDEFVALPELVELAVRCGFASLAVAEAGLDEWDEFESGYSARYAAWLAEHGSDHPDADEVRARAARQRTAYLGGYRGILGFAYLSLLAV